MKVKVAKTAGFCFGVKRAVDKVYEQAEKSELPIYTYGPIIHNEEVVKDLEARGVRVINGKEELEKLESGTFEKGKRDYETNQRARTLLKKERIHIPSNTSVIFFDKIN